MYWIKLQQFVRFLNKYSYVVLTLHRFWRNLGLHRILNLLWFNCMLNEWVARLPLSIDVFDGKICNRNQPHSDYNPPTQNRFETLTTRVLYCPRFLEKCFIKSSNLYSICMVSRTTKYNDWTYFVDTA